MTGIILSLLATLAALVFAFHSDDAYGRTGRRLQDYERRNTRKSDDLRISARPDSKGSAAENLNHRPRPL